MYSTQDLITSTQLFPPVGMLRFFMRHSRMRRMHSTLQVLTLFVMNATIITVNVCATHRV